MTDSYREKAAVLIPAYKPDERLVTLTSALVGAGLRVMLVDDGGGETYAHFFADCRALGAKVAVHSVNLGKGRALKTGINAALAEWPDLCGLVTADSDGQHTPGDILRIMDAMEAHPEDLVLGSRAFTGNVPAKSLWGNRITRAVYHAVSGIKVGDTQTGLRGLPRKALAEMTRVEGERYEYEMNILLQVKQMGLKVFEVPIETIYIDDNAGSHFNPVRDAMKIYGVIFKHFIRFTLSSVLAFVIDYALYWLLLSRTGLAAWACYALARLVSSQVNYHVNHHLVFGGNGGKYAMAKYYALCLCQGALGAALVQILPGILPVGAKLIKIPVDVILFLLSYGIQRDVVFGRKKK